MSSPPRPTPPPRSDRVLLIMASVLLVAAIGSLVWMVADVLMLAFAGILVAVFLHGLSSTVSKLTGMPQGWSMAVVLTVLATLLILIGWFLGAEIVSQLDQLVPRLQKSWGQLRAEVRHYEWGRTLLANTSLKALAKDREWLAHITGGLFSTTLGAIVSLLVIFFIGLYAAAAPRTYLEGLLRLVPLRGRKRAAQVLEAVGETLKWWLIGTLIKMATVGTAVTLGLLLLDMPLALALGLIAFLLEFVPYVGPVMSAVPAVLVALAVGPTQALYVGLLYLAVQSAEGYIISPLVDQRAVRLPPALTIASQLLLGTSSLGLLGIFIATPLTAVSMVLIKMLYIEDFLGECTDASEASEGDSCVPARLPQVGKPTGSPEKRESGS